MDKITAFVGEYRWLSNFWPSPVWLSDEVYSTVEHAYQAAKTLDLETRKMFQRQSVSAAVAKRLGRGLVIREDWEGLKMEVMRSLLIQKFTNTHLTDLLISTGDMEIIEGNWWGDTFWGVCKGEGQNHLGRLIMEIRSTLHGR